MSSLVIWAASVFEICTQTNRGKNPTPETAICMANYFSHYVNALHLFIILISIILTNLCKISPHQITSSKKKTMATKHTTYSAVSFFPPPRDGTNLLLSADCCGAFLAGGLLMATDIVCSPIWWPSIFSTACAADVCSHVNIYFTPVWVWSIVIRVSVCLSVCWHVSKTMRPNFTIIFCMLPVARSSSDGNAICTSSFVDDVMFSYNRRNKLESKKTRMFHPFCQVAALGAKCAISNCILLTLNSCMSRGSSGRGTGHRQFDAQLFGRHAANLDKSFTNCSHPVQIVSSDTLKLGR